MFYFVVESLCFIRLIRLNCLMNYAWKEAARFLGSYADVKLLWSKMFTTWDADLLLIKLIVRQLILKHITKNCNCNNIMRIQHKLSNLAFEIIDTKFIFMHDSLHNTIMKFKFSIIPMISTAWSNDIKAHNMYNYYLWRRKWCCIHCSVLNNLL